MVNNGKGCEFTHYLNPGHIFREDVDPYIAAAGHYGNQSRTLVRDYAKNLGIDYLSASSKEEFLENMEVFLSTDVDRSFVFEAFTRDIDENEALRLITSTGLVGDVKQVLKEKVGNVIGEKGMAFVKRILK